MQNVPQTWQDSLMIGLTSTITQFSLFLPRIVGAILIFFIGILVVRVVRRLIVKTLEALRISKAIEKTPLELFLKDKDMGLKIEEVIADVFYWLFLFLVLQTAVSVLGLTPLSTLMSTILDYIPHIFSALFIFLFGVLLAGLIESFIKQTMRSLGSHTARLFSKIASYMVVAIAGLAAVAELGIAAEFIKILFLGLVFAFSLGVGLAVGLGGQDIVRKILGSWYDKTKE